MNKPLKRQVVGGNPFGSVSRGLVLSGALVLGACGAVRSAVFPTSTSALGGKLLGATYGADDFGGLFGCASMAAMDGVPVVFPVQVVAQTVVPASFLVTNASGQAVTPVCATFAPAVDPDELRTVLLQGAFGQPTTNEPVSVTMTGNILDVNGTSYQGASVAVQPYSMGQYLVYARRLPISGEVGGANQCPTQNAQGLAIQQVIQLAFGSNAGGNFPATAAYRANFQVRLADGATAVPVAFGDMTADNYLELCLTDTSPALSVSIAPGAVPDASGQMNAATSIALEN